jgi:hypothetical protein
MSKIRSAAIALASPRPTIAEAIKQTQSLASCFTQEMGDDRLNAIVEIFRHFPLSIVRECTDLWSGIACERILDTKTGALRPRRLMPSNGEIRNWCEERVAVLTKLAKAADYGRDIESGSVRPPPSAEERARVETRCKDTVEYLKRAAGVRTPEEEARRAALIDAAERRDLTSMLAEYERRGVPVPGPASYSSKCFSHVLISPSLVDAVNGTPPQPLDMEKVKKA